VIFFFGLLLFNKQFVAIRGVCLTFG